MTEHKEPDYIALLATIPEDMIAKFVPKIRRMNIAMLNDQYFLLTLTKAILSERADDKFEKRPHWEGDESQETYEAFQERETQFNIQFYCEHPQLALLLLRHSISSFKLHMTELKIREEFYTLKGTREQWRGLTDAVRLEHFKGRKFPEPERHDFEIGKTNPSPFPGS